PVFVIATANNISALPPEMMRKGRFDEIFFVDLPTERERIEIFNVHLQKRLTAPQAKGDFVINDDVLLKLAQLSEGFVGAEIEQVVINGMFEAFSENRAVQLSDFQKIAEQIVPLSITQAEHIKALREWANVRAVAATPQVDRQGYMNQQQEPIVKEPSDIEQERGGRTIDF
ncbi:MAG: ATPase, partial [Lysinibacillus sp.]